MHHASRLKDSTIAASPQQRSLALYRTPPAHSTAPPPPKLSPYFENVTGWTPQASNNPLPALGSGQTTSFMRDTDCSQDSADMGRNMKTPFLPPLTLKSHLPTPASVAPLVLFMSVTDVASGVKRQLCRFTRSVGRMETYTSSSCLASKLVGYSFPPLAVSGTPFPLTI